MNCTGHLKKKTDFKMYFLILLICSGSCSLKVSKHLSKYNLLTEENKLIIQAYLILLRFALLCFTDVAFFYKLKARPSTSRKIMTCFIGVVWNLTLNISEVCLSLFINSFESPKKKFLLAKLSGKLR